MLEYVLTIVIGGIITWVGLLIVVPIAQKLADFSMPPWPEALWRLAVIALGVNVVTVAVDPINVWLSWAAGAVVFWFLMWKWFQVDLFGAFVIVAVTGIARVVLLGLGMGLLSGLG